VRVDRKLQVGSIRGEQSLNELTGLTGVELAVDVPNASELQWKMD